jgi:hypothetical protein
MRRAIIAVIGAILVWSIQDAIVWRNWFEGRPELFQSAELYQFWHQATLVALLIAGMLWVSGRAWQLWFAGATWILANSGLPDVLYYWLALQPIPKKLPWLDITHPLVLGHPATSWTVVGSSILWLDAAIAAGLVLTTLLGLVGFRKSRIRQEVA